MKRSLLILVLLLSHSLLWSQTIRFVNWSATGSNNGTSWTNAFTDLQLALNAASNGDLIFVAAGVYKPTTILGSGSNSRDRVFRLKSGVAVYGGFSGNESNLNDRDDLLIKTTNATYLSGDLGVIGDTSDNAYHVLLALNLVSSATLDGFFIEGGYANDTTVNVFGATGIKRDFGGGIYTENSKLNMNNCEISGVARSGGAGMNNENASTMNITNCLFVLCEVAGNNSSQYGGAGMRNYNSSPNINNCEFFLNIVSNAQGGGGMRNEMNSSPVIQNSEFQNNTAINGDGGAGMYNASGSNPLITSTDFLENGTINQGGGMYNDNSKPILVDVRFELNYGGGGGGAMENDGGSDAVLTDVIFWNNSTLENGGAIQNWKSSPVFTDVTFTLNDAGKDGGAMYNYNDCSPKVTNAMFNYNKAGGNGGAIYNRRNCNPILTNLLIFQNEAGGYGGGVYSVSSNSSPCSPIATNLSISNNRADTSGGGSYDDGLGNPKLRNSIISGNASPGADDVDAPSSLVATALFRTIIGRDYYINGVTTPITVSGYIFKDTTGPVVDYRLRPGSPGIDKGDSSYFNTGQSPDLSGIQTDLYLIDRIMGTNIDLGALEVCGDTGVLIVSLAVSPSQSVPSNTQVVFTASYSGGGANATLTWYKNGALIPFSGSVYPAIAGVDFKDGDKIHVTLISDDPCSNKPSLQSEKITMTVLVGIDEIANQIAADVYPNPSNGSFTLEVIDFVENETSIRIFHADGRLVHQEAIRSSITRVDLPPSCADGIYLLEVKGVRGRAVKRLALRR